MNENTFRNTVKREAKRFDPDMHIWKINDNFAGGVPDYHFERSDAERWVEAKYLADIPKRDSTVIDLSHKKWLSALQLDWLERREDRFGDAAVLLGVGKTRCEGVLVFRHKTWLTPFKSSWLRDNLAPPKHIFTNLFD